MTKEIRKILKTIIISLMCVLMLSSLSCMNSFNVYAEDSNNEQDITNTENENTNEEITPQSDGESLEYTEDKNTNMLLSDPSTNNNNENNNSRSDWLHYSIDLIWDIDKDDQKINQTVVTTNSTSELYPKYKFTIQTSTVDYAPEAMEFTLPLSLFSKRTDLLDNKGQLIVFNPDKFYPYDISITDDPDSSHSSSYYYIEDRENDKLIIKNRETIYAGTNATIQVMYSLDPDSIYDMSVGKLQATGICTPTSETPGAVLPPEEATSREITYSLDTGFSSLNIVNTSCKFEQYAIKDGYRYYYVVIYSHPYGNQAYEQFFDFDFLESDGQFVGPIENVDSGTTMNLSDASNYYKKTSYGRPQGEDVYHELGNYETAFYVRYPDTDETKEDKLKITTRIIGSDNDGYNHEDPDKNDIVSNSIAFKNTWIKYPDKPIGDYYKSPIGQERDRLEIFSPISYDTFGRRDGAAYFTMGVDNDSVVGRSGNNNKLVITDTGLVPENDAPEFDYEFSDVRVPLINVTPKQYNEASQSIGEYTGTDPWYDELTIEGSPNGIDWSEVYSGDGKDYNSSSTTDLWYGKGYKKFRITFSGIKENVALTGEFARASLKSNEYDEEFLSREVLDQYRNWMHVDIINSNEEVEGIVDDWAMLTLTPYKEVATSNVAKRMGKIVSNTEDEIVYVDFNLFTNLVIGSNSLFSIYNKEYLSNFGKEMKKLKEVAPDYFEGMYSLDEFGDGIMYDLLPPGYHFEEIIKSTPPYSTGTGYSINGSHTSQEEIWPDYEVIDNYKDTGRELVIFRFPIKDAIEEYDDASVVNIRLELNYTTSIKWEDLVYYQNERNFLAVQSENGIPIYNAFPDDGAPERESVNLSPFQEDLMTDDGMPAFYDINKDGDTTIENTLYAYVTVSPNVVMSTQSGIDKDIMGDSGEWCKLDHTDINETYKYRIRVHVAEAGKLSDLIIYDTLEEAANTNEWEGEVPWKGIFQSVDTSYLIRHGFDPVVYYSTAPVENLDYNIITGRENNPWINDKDIWTTDIPDDLSTVTAIAVDCRKMADGSDAELKESMGIEFVIKMTAPPEYPTIKNPEMIYAYNRPAYSCMMYASFSADPDYFTDIGHRVQIYLEPKTQVTVKKIWADGNNSRGLRPDKITVNLLANGEVIDTKDITPDENGNWELKFDTMPMLDENNKKIEYTIEEINVEGYTTTIEGNQVEGYTITNTINEEGKLTIRGKKTWDDSNNIDGIRPDSITINLLADGKKVKSIKVTKEGGWKYEFKDLPETNKDGKKINYTITEDEVIGYKTIINGYNVTNWHKPEEPRYTPPRTGIE